MDIYIHIHIHMKQNKTIGIAINSYYAHSSSLATTSFRTQRSIPSGHRPSGQRTSYATTTSFRIQRSLPSGQRTLCPTFSIPSRSFLLFFSLALYL
jgi:hypothetical protein